MLHFTVIIVGIMFCSIASTVSFAGMGGRFVESIQLPSGETVVVAEGDFEPRSIGSYSIRVYAAAASENKMDFFLCGLVEGRDGTVEKIAVARIDLDETSDVVVVIRSVGTGNYLSAAVFSVRDNRIIQIADVEGLNPGTHVINALQRAAASR